MEYPDNRGKFRHTDVTVLATKQTKAVRGAPPRDTFHPSEVNEPQVEVVVAPPPPWNAVPDAKDFEI